MPILGDCIAEQLGCKSRQFLFADGFPVISFINSTHFALSCDLSYLNTPVLCDIANIQQKVHGMSTPRIHSRLQV